MDITLRLLERCHEAENVTSFRFEPQTPVPYQAGQYFRFMLPHPEPDQRGVARYFTIASAPSEPFIMLTTRLSRPGSTFKHALAGLEPGALVTASGPLGRFVYTPSERPAVFIAGGIGITPFRSMLVERAARPHNAEITVLYANRTDDIAFKRLLDELANAHPWLHVVYIISHPSADWRGPVGHIDAEFIGHHVSHRTEAQFFVSGPRPLVEAMDQALGQLGVPRERVKHESFPGYNT